VEHHAHLVAEQDVPASKAASGELDRLQWGLILIAHPGAPLKGCAAE